MVGTGLNRRGREFRVKGGCGGIGGMERGECGHTLGRITWCVASIEASLLCPSYQRATCWQEKSTCFGPTLREWQNAT